MASTLPCAARKPLTKCDTFFHLMFLDGCDWRRVTRSNKSYKVAQVRQWCGLSHCDNTSFLLLTAGSVQRVVGVQIVRQDARVPQGSCSLVTTTSTTSTTSTSAATPSTC